MDAKIRLHICLPHICVEPVLFCFAVGIFSMRVRSFDFDVLSRKLVNSYQSQTYGQRLPQLYIMPREKKGEQLKLFLPILKSSDHSHA